MNTSTNDFVSVLSDGRTIRIPSRWLPYFTQENFITDDTEITFLSSMPRAKQLEFMGNYFTIDLDDGRKLTVPYHWSPRLQHATTEERRHYELSGNGAYIHWPDIDEDLSLLSLLAGHANRESEASIERWLAQRQTAQTV